MTMNPTETLAKLLEESGAQIVLPKEVIRKAFAALQDEVARLTQERDEERRYVDAIESQKNQYPNERYEHCLIVMAPGKTLRQTLDEYLETGAIQIDAARKAGA